MMLRFSAAMLVLLSLPAFAENIPACPPPDGFHATMLMADFPLPVAASLREHVPNLAPPSASFNGGDALMPGQHVLDRRLIGAFYQDQTWVIAYEAAGRGYHDVVVAYRLSDDGRSAEIISKAQTFPGNICEAMKTAPASKGPIDPYW
jgi:hypothetical protein